MLETSGAKDSVITEISFSRFSSTSLAHRSGLIKWLDETKQKYTNHITPAILTYAVSYFDSFLDCFSNSTIEDLLIDFDSVGRACLLVSSKVHSAGYDFLTAADVACLGEVYEVEDILIMEMELCKILDYSLHPPIPHTSSSLILQSTSGKIDEDETEKIGFHVHDLLHQAISNPTLLQAHSSFALGAAAVFVAMEIFGSGMTQRVGRNMRLAYLKGVGLKAEEHSSAVETQNIFREFAVAMKQKQKNEKKIARAAGAQQQRTIRKSTRRRKRRDGLVDLCVELIAAVKALDDGRVGSSVVTIQKYLTATNPHLKETTAISIRDCLVARSSEDSFFKQIGRSGRWMLRT